MQIAAIIKVLFQINVKVWHCNHFSDFATDTDTAAVAVTHIVNALCVLLLSCCTTTTTVATAIANKNATHSWLLQILILFVSLC